MIYFFTQIILSHILGCAQIVRKYAMRKNAQKCLWSQYIKTGKRYGPSDLFALGSLSKLFGQGIRIRISLVIQGRCYAGKTFANMPSANLTMIQLCI